MKKYGNCIILKVSHTSKEGALMQDAELRSVVAKNITALRTQNNMTQLELGAALSYSDKAVSKWERAEGIPDAYVLLKMSELFGCNVDYLLHSHEESEKMPGVGSRVNHVSVSLISLLGVWTVAVLAFVIMHLSGFTYPLIFAYTLVVSAILLTVFNALWGNRLWRFISISALVWSVLAAVYFVFLSVGANYWQLLLVGVPGQLIVLLCFFIRRQSVKKSG